MDYNEINNINEEQILHLYNDIVEAGYYKSGNTAYNCACCFRGVVDYTCFYYRDYYQGEWVWINGYCPKLGLGGSIVNYPYDNTCYTMCKNVVGGGAGGGYGQNC